MPDALGFSGCPEPLWTPWQRWGQLPPPQGRQCCVEASRAGSGGMKGVVCGWTSSLAVAGRMGGANDDVSRETESQHAQIAAAAVEEPTSTRGIPDE